MKRFLLLLAAVGMLATACMPDGSPIDGYNGNHTQQPGDGNEGGNNDTLQDEITLSVETSSVPNMEASWFIMVTSNCNWSASADKR